MVDTTFSRDLSLREHGREFRRRKWLQREGKGKGKAREGGGSNLPMLASACPGWVCYAEKAQHELLELVSRTKSPMLMAGVLAKRWSSTIESSEGQEERDLSCDNPSTSASKNRKTFHLSIMPCYDKKLESARPSVSETQSQVEGLNGNQPDLIMQRILEGMKEEDEKDVDLVLTTGELIQLMADEGFDLEKEVEGEREFLKDESCKDLEILSRNRESGPCKEVPSLLNHPDLASGSSSGGYLFSVLQDCWSDWLENQTSSSEASLPTLMIRTIRSSDYTEYVLKAPTLDGKDGEILFKGAHCYGFRNLQNLVRKVKVQIKKEEVDEADSTSRSSRGKVIRGGKMNVRGRGGKMIKRGGGVGNSSTGPTKISLDDFSLSSFNVSSASSSMINPEEPSSRVHQVDQDPFSSSIPYDYVEIMACPGGCVNGGGQLRPPTPGNNILLNGKETANLIGGPAGSFASGIGRESGITEAQADGGGEKTLKGGENKMEVDDRDIDEVGEGEGEEVTKGWKGTSKQWVGKVEEAYWKRNSSEIEGEKEKEGDEVSISSSSNSTALTTPSPSIKTSSTQSSISLDLQFRLDSQLMKQTLNHKTRSKFKQLEELEDGIVREICRSYASESQEERIKEALFMTNYKAVKDEAVSGLAVQW